METPHDKLFVFKPEELKSLKFGDDSAGFAARNGAIDAFDDKKVIDFAWPAVLQR